MGTFPEDLFNTVKARIVGGDERQVVGILGEAGGIRVMETTELLFVNERGGVPSGSEDSSEV